MAHTSGPWSVRGKYHSCHPEGTKFFCHGVEAPDGANTNTGDSHNIACYAYGHTPEQAEAYARLIASAPTMLAALKGIRDIADGLDDLSENWAKELDAVEAAILEAEGRAK